MKRFCALLTAVLLLFCVGCKKPADTELSADADLPQGSSVVVTPDGRKMLTGIFESEYISLPEGMRLSTAVRPAYDPDTGLLQVLATSRIYETVSDGEQEFEFPVDHFSVVTLYPDGSSSEVPIPLHWSGFVACGAFDEDGLCFVQCDQSSQKMRVTLNRLSPDGSISDLDADMDALFSRGFPDRMFLFPNGDTLYIQQNQAVLLGADGVRKAEDSAENVIFDAGMTASGKILLTWSAGAGAVIAELDPESGGFGQKIALGSEINTVRFGPEYDFFYTDGNGVQGAFLDGESWTSEPLLNYVNSGLDRSSESLVAPLDPEAMLFHRVNQDKTLLYRYRPDLDLADLKILTVGCDSTASVSPVFASAVGEFQRSHPDVRVVTEDYVGYDTKEKPDGGETKLATDLVTGLFKPDILIGPADADYMTQAYEKGLYRDLAPFLDKTGEIFGCVKRLYDDGRGGMWGVTPFFSVETVFADPARLGTYGEQGFLSPNDFVDLAENLEAGQSLLTELPRGIVSFNWLFRNGCGYRAFIDREAGTASFDSPEFIRLLEYLAALPTEEDAKRSSPFAGMSPEEIMRLRNAGQVLLTERRNPWTWVEPELWTGTEEWTMIGYPTGESRSGAGTQVTPKMTLLITSWCGEPDLAEELVGTVLRMTLEEDAGWFPILKSVFREKAEKRFGEIYAPFYSGGAGVWSEDNPHPASADELDQPGILTRFTPEKAARLEAMLDSAGVPLRLSDDSEIVYIVRDEVMSFLSGIGTAGDCAAKIQSRVSLWLAEHK